MKYVVMTTRHHEGFSLWNSKVNEFNSVNYGPHRDIVREFVDACHEEDMKIGFYSSLMDWHNEDGWRAATDSEARRRFNEYIYELNRELLTNYGKIDILWYDMANPMESYEGWNSLEMNQRLRELQPDIIINNRSRLDEDFGTPEGAILARDGDWEACMTFNNISWCYSDPEQIKAYSYTPQQIIHMLSRCATNKGNLLLNIGPEPDGSVPKEAIEPLEAVGRWMKANERAVYSGLVDCGNNTAGGNGVCSVTCNGKSVFLWNFLWPTDGKMGIGGYMNSPKTVRYVHNGEPIEFEHKGHRVILKNLPKKSPAPELGIAVIEMEFEEKPEYCFCSYYPQFNGGRAFIDKRI